MESIRGNEGAILDLCSKCVLFLNLKKDVVRGRHIKNYFELICDFQNILSFVRLLFGSQTEPMCLCAQILSPKT